MARILSVPTPAFSVEGLVLRHFMWASCVFIAVVGAVLVSHEPPWSLPRSEMAEIGRLHLFWREDGVAEWATVVLDLLAGVLFAVALWRGFRLGVLRRSREGLFLAALAFVLIFTAGEEISWGQRLFGFSTPDAVAAINKQQEFNLHNLDGIHRWKDIVAALATLVWGVILPVAALYSKGIARICRRLWLPLPPVWCVSYFAAAVGCRILLEPIYGNGAVEAFEMMFALAMTILAVRAVKAPAELYRR